MLIISNGCDNHLYKKTVKGTRTKKNTESPAAASIQFTVVAEEVVVDCCTVRVFPGELIVSTEQE